MLRAFASVAALTFLATACTTPGCQQAARDVLDTKAADGWRVVGSGGAGAAADFVMWLSPDGEQIKVTLIRMDGSDPSDADLETNSFAKDSVCTWDGDPLPQGEDGVLLYGPDGSFWSKSTPTHN